LREGGGPGSRTSSCRFVWKSRPFLKKTGKRTNLLTTIESFNRQFQVGEKEREAVEWAWEQEMGKTMFHVVNAYTRAAQIEGLPAEASYRLQKVGGMVLGMVK
jgi:hypothetical protein